MVSKASDDFPDPLSPVMTVRVLRGISTSIFLRLCWRAPCTVMRLSICRGGDFILATGSGEGLGRLRLDGNLSSTGGASRVVLRASGGLLFAKFGELPAEREG